MAKTQIAAETAGGEATSIRALTPSERFFCAAAPGVYVGYSCLCAGTLDLGALDDAFGELQRQHPLLRSVIRKSGVGFEFAMDDHRSSPAHVRIFSGEDPHAQVTGLGAGFYQARQLVYLDVIPGDGEARATLFVHHSAADGRHALALLQELWGRYAHRVETGERLPVRPQPFPQSLEHYLVTREHPGSGRLLGPDELPPEDSEGQEAPGRADARVRPNAMLPARVRLSRAETQSLIDFCHAEGITVNALVSAALVRARAREDAPLALYAYMVDLRGRVDPPVGLTEVTNMIRSVAFPADGRSECLVGLARRIGGQLADVVADGTAHTGVAQLPLSAPQPGEVLHSTNWGRIPPLRTPSGMRIVDFQSCFPPPPSGGETRMYVILTFDGQLSVETFAGEQARAIFGRIGEELGSAVRAEAGQSPASRGARGS